MKPIKTLIVDDESLARQFISKHLEQQPEIEIAASCENGFEALKQIQKHRPDLVFLDIQMPKLTGFELLELLENPPVIVFSTAYDQYAIQAFEKNAVDYLLKPYSGKRLLEALEKAKLRLNGRQANQIEKLKDDVLAPREYVDRIVIKDGNDIVVVGVGEIHCLEAQDDYVEIVTAKGSYLKQQTMKFYEDHLDPKHFVRVHRSFIVRLEEIEKVERY